MGRKSVFSFFLVRLFCSSRAGPQVAARGGGPWGDPPRVARGFSAARSCPPSSRPCSRAVAARRRGRAAWPCGVAVLVAVRRGRPRGRDPRGRRLSEGAAGAPARARPRTRRPRRPARSPARAARRRQRHAPAAVACLTCRARRGRGRVQSAAGTPPPARRGPETQRGPHAPQSVRPRGRRAVSCAPPWRRPRAYPLAPSLVVALHAHERRGASIVPTRSPVATSTTSRR